LPVAVGLTFYWANGIQIWKALSKKLGSQFVEEMNRFEFLYGRFLLPMELASADKDDGQQCTEQD